MSRHAAERDPDRLSSVESGPETELKVKGSRFLAQAFPAGDETAAKKCLDAVRKRYHDASHHCWALRLAPPERPLERADDDGEPSGTGGVPILGAIRRCDLFDLIVVVTRYFGGTKLGTGGLARAYAEAARQALESAPRREIWRESVLTIRCAYDDLGAVEAAVARAGDAIREAARSFSGVPELRLRVRKSQGRSLAEAVTDATAGRAAVDLTDDDGFPSGDTGRR
jgi:uncharacterized YigZ family protein